MASDNRGTDDVLPAFQRVVERLEERADRNLTRFNKDKCQAVRVGKKTTDNGPVRACLSRV